MTWIAHAAGWWLIVWTLLFIEERWETKFPMPLEVALVGTGLTSLAVISLVNLVYFLLTR